MKIKSLSMILMLALCLSVSGVYATWTYAEAEVASVDTTAKLSIDEAVVSGAAGTLAVDASELTMKVVNGGGYTTKLAVTGTVSVTFTPTAETDASKVPTAFTWSISATDAALAADHGGEKILTGVTTTPQNITLNAENSYTVTIQASEIAALIDLTEITLETSDEHALYKAIVDGLDAFTITVAPAN